MVGPLHILPIRVLVARRLVLWHSVSVTYAGQAAWVWLLVGVVVGEDEPRRVSQRARSAQPAPAAAHLRAHPGSARTPRLQTTPVAISSTTTGPETYDHHPAKPDTLMSGLGTSSLPTSLRSEPR